MLRSADISGLVLTIAVVAAAIPLGELTGVSSLVLGVVFGVMLANSGRIGPSLQPGVAFAGKRLLRVGIVFLGLRLSFDEVRSLGVNGAVAVIVVVVVTFFGVQLLGRWLGLSGGLGLLVATGCAICGASAIAAMEPLARADEEETAYAIGIVTLCGTLSIFVFPLIGHALGLSNEMFGTWVGAGVHDVGQVTATASAYTEQALAPATLVKLTRVMMLAPIVASVGILRRRQARAAAASEASDVECTSAPIVPLFVALFIAMIGLRATGWLSEDVLSAGKLAEKIFLTAGMFGLGAGVRVARLRRLGGRPLALGLTSWVLVGGMSLGAASLVH